MAEEKKDVDVSAEAPVKAEEVKVEEAAPAAAEAKAEEAAPAVAEAKPEAVAEAPAEESKSRLPTAADLLADEKIEPIKRKKGSKNVPFGIAFVKTTFNNTIVSITDMRGNVVSWSSAGRCNFKGSRKSTAFAATTVAQDAARTAISHGMSEVEVRVQGPGAGRESAVRAIQSAGLAITAIKDTTAIPHNGCRPPKRRRV
jgi:small subunit ribosomal protein S11